MTGSDIEPITANPAAQLERISTNPDDLARFGTWMAMAASGSKDPKAVGAANALKMVFATSMGFPLTAAAEVHLINGQFALSAKLCRALAPSHGLRVIPVEETDDSCTAAVVEIATGKELGRRTYTLAMAKKQGLSGTNWTRTPDRMLWARASKRVLDDFAPEVTVGIMSYEEIGDQAFVDEMPEAELVDENGEPFKDAD